MRVALLKTLASAGSLSVLLLVFSWMCIPREALAGPAVRLDPSFGKQGVSEVGDGGRAVEISPLPGGSSIVAEPLGGYVKRLHADGSLDESFGRHGLLHLGLGTASAGNGLRTFSSRAIVADGRGRTVVFGEQASRNRSGDGVSYALVLRFDRHGHRDPSFGAGRGFVRYDFGLTSPTGLEGPLVGALGGVVDSEDRPVLIAGVGTQLDGCLGKVSIGEVPRAVVRLTSTGLPDPSFGSGGVVPIEGSTTLTRLVVGDQDELAVGVGRIGGARAECRVGGTVYRLGSGGEQVAGFGSEGLFSLRRAYRFAFDSAGGLVVTQRQRQRLEVLRFSADGTQNPDFGGEGSATVRLPRKRGVEISSVLVDAEGRVLLAGSFPATEAKRGRSGFLVARLLADGSLDPRFGNRGWMVTSFPRRVRITSAQAILDEEGRLLVAGSATPRDNPDGEFVVARYLLGP